MSKKIWDYFLITVGCIIMAIALNVFLVPYRIAPGGVSGIATVIYHLTSGKMPVGLTMLLINIPLFILGYNNIGKGFIIKTVYGTVILSLFIDLSEPFLHALINKYLLSIDQSLSQPDLLLYSLFGGFLIGVGLGLVLAAGATTGGTDLAASIIHRIIQTQSVGQILMLIDGLVIVFATVAFRSFKLGLYAIVSMYITSKVVDTIVEGISISKGIFIISDKWDEISKSILVSINRGVTSFYGKGMYSNIDRQILLCVAKRNEIPRIKSIVKEIDKNAFIFVSDMKEVFGEGFGE